MPGVVTVRHPYGCTQGGLGLGTTLLPFANLATQRDFFYYKRTQFSFFVINILDTSMRKRKCG